MGSTQVENGTRILGLTVRGQTGLAVATQVQRVHVRVWAQAGRLDVVASCRYKSCIVGGIGLPLWGVIHPTVGPARVSTS